MLNLFSKKNTSNEADANSITAINFYKHKNECIGKNNRLVINHETCKIKKLDLKIKGHNNTITIGDNCELNITNIHIVGNSHNIFIGNNCKITGKLAVKGKKGTIKIGDKTTAKNIYFLAEESKNIIVGEDCMFSKGIMVRTSDAHSIINLDTGERKNKAQSIEIGNHVWVGMEAIITKGVKIADNCVIGTRALVTKSFEEKNCSIAGIPAKVLNRGIDWRREKI